MPKDTTWASAKAALESALELEIEVNNALHEVHGKADRECNDPQVIRRRFPFPQHYFTWGECSLRFISVRVTV